MQLGNWSVANAIEYGYLRVSADPQSFVAEFVVGNSGVVIDKTALTPWW
jgi:hypothetical protein